MNSRGNISLLVLGIMFFISVIGLATYHLTHVDLKTTYNTYWKSKSNALVDFALEEYRDRINSMFILNDEYYIKDIDLSLLDTSTFLIEEDGKVKAQVEFKNVEFEETDFETEYDYYDDLAGNSVASYGKALYKNPPVDDTFEELSYNDIIGNEAGNVSTSAIYNPAYGSNEFFVSKAVFNQDREFEGIRISNFFPLVEDKPDEQLIYATKEELEALSGFSLDRMTVNDSVQISVSWDKVIKSPILILSTTLKDEGTAHFFTLRPIIETTFTYFDSTAFTSEIESTKLSSVFDENKFAISVAYSVFEKHADETKTLSTYFIDLPFDTEFDKTKSVSITLEEKYRNADVSFFWSDITNSPELLAYVVRDDDSVTPVLFNSIISIFKASPTIHTSYQLTDEINIQDYGAEGIHSLASNVYWDEHTNDGYANLLFSTPPDLEGDIEQRLFHLETNIIGFNATEVKEINMTDYNLENIGRMTISGHSSGIGELLGLIERTIVRTEKVILRNKEEQNIVITVFEDNNTDRIASRTNITIKPEIAITTVEESSERVVKNFTILDMSIE